MENQSMEQQFLALVKIMENMQNRVHQLEQGNQLLVRSNQQLIQLLEDNQKELSDYQRNCFFEFIDRASHEPDLWYPTILSEEETLNQLIDSQTSFARFGDGEFSAIAGRIRHQFQTAVDPQLGQRLLEVLHCQDPRLLIGLADNYGSLEKYNAQAKREIRRYMHPMVRREHLRLLDPERTYYNAYVTRPYVMYDDNQTDAPGKRFRHLQRLWSGKNCIFVEGNMTGLGVGNDLFENTASIKRILAPAENAFSAYSPLLEFCLRQPADSLFLLALGPTATVLAWDLCRAGYRAIDIGHIDLEYEWFLRGEGHRTQVAGKYNNEVAAGNHPSAIEDAAYCSQIIGDFSA